MSYTTFGTLSTLDTLASNFQQVAEYGEENAYGDFERLRVAHNRLMDTMLGSFVQKTTSRLDLYGAGSTMVMEQLDEFGIPHPQKIRAGSNVGYPLNSYQGALQWTRKFMINARVSEFAANIIAMFTADNARVAIEIKKALFTGTNYTTNDMLVDNLGNTGLGSGVLLPVKALVNADSAEIPVGPDGQTFNGATHTHYLAAASGGTLAVGDVNPLIDTVAEHFADGNLQVYINRADETAFRALTGFVAYTDVRVVGSISSNQAPGTPLVPANIFNRAIGVYRGAEIWVKPWIPQWYLFCFMQGQPPPLRFRERSAGSGGLNLVFEDEKYPLRARVYEREFGVGAFHRTNGAVLYYNGTSYVSPVISTALS